MPLIYLHFRIFSSVADLGWNPDPHIGQKKVLCGTILVPTLRNWSQKTYFIPYSILPITLVPVAKAFIQNYLSWDSDPQLYEKSDSIPRQN